MSAADEVSVAAEVADDISAATSVVAEVSAVEEVAAEVSVEAMREERETLRKREKKKGWGGTLPIGTLREAERCCSHQKFETLLAPGRAPLAIGGPRRRALLAICYSKQRENPINLEALKTEMEEEMEMEVETEARTNTSLSSSSPLKRLGLKNTIHTNFGDDYVFQIASSKPGDLNIGSFFVLKHNQNLFSSNWTIFWECKGHSGTIHEVAFSAPSSAHIFCSCSSDGTIRAWDTRSFKQISMLSAGSPQEIFSFSFGGSSGNLLAAGSNAQLLCAKQKLSMPDEKLGSFDMKLMQRSILGLEKSKQLACLEESHMEDVTQVRFVPSQQNKLISSSVDGLLCLFETDGEINDDDNLLSVMNEGTSIAKVGFFGSRNQKLWCLTHIETLSIWDWDDASREANFENARSVASDRWNLDQIDYFVDCHYSTTDDRLWVIGGTGSGTLGYFPINPNPVASIGPAEAILEGGHSGVVRSVLPASSTRISSLAQIRACLDGPEVKTAGYVAGYLTNHQK
uniref:Uncharacterized protein n=1 Tax=Ananas comosus var. bracteatus TaxID=296719 RepID=A0A6V7PV53_ANACO|nr:unnamed protein product [Ananas comosus var. bracteatus]